MKRPSEAEIDGLFIEAAKRSGSDAIVEYPVPRAGIAVFLGRLSRDDWREAWDGIQRGGHEGKTARNVALSRARLWPDQQTTSAACEAVPGLAKELWDRVERLHGGDIEYLTIQPVRGTMTDGDIAAMGIDPARLAALRKRYPHDDTLRIAHYRDEETSIEWSCVLRLPATSALETIMRGLNERGHETMVNLAINCLAEPSGEAAAAFVRGEYAIGPALWAALYTWSQEAAKARPTILRPKSRISATSTASPTSSEKSSGTSESNGAKPPAQAASSSPG